MASPALDRLYDAYFSVVMTGPIDYASMMKQLISGLQSNVAYDPITNKNRGMNPLAATERARPNYPGGGSALQPLPPGRARHNTLSPAVKFDDGSIGVAKRGQHHADVYDAGAAAGKTRGSVVDGWLDNRTGQFLTRDQAYTLFNDKSRRINDYLERRGRR